MKKTILWTILALLLPVTQAWGGTGSSTTYYAALKASVSNTGGGTVYAGTSNSASGASYATLSTSDSQNSTMQNEEKTFYAFAQADEGFEFAGWATSDGGTVASTDNPYVVTVKCSSSTESSPTTTTVWANFKKKLLAAFGITFETSDAGTYTVDGAAPANKTDLTQATTVKLASADSNFLNWKVNGAIVNGNPYDLTCTADTTVGAEFLTADQVAEATTFAELTAALANDGKRKITIPSGVDITIAKGATVTVPAGKQLVVDGGLLVVGTLTNGGAISGNGTIYKISYLIEQGEIKKPLQVTGEEWGNMLAKAYKPYYRITTTTGNTPTITLGAISGCVQKWAVLFKGKAYTITKQNPKALKVTFNTAVAANDISAIADNADVDTVGDDYCVLLADCGITGYNDSKGRAVYSKTVDCAGKTVTMSGTGGKIAGSSALFLNGAVSISPSSENQNSAATFINCSSITLKKIKGVSPAYYFYDCGSAGKMATLSFAYYSGPNTTDFRQAYFYSGYYSYTFSSAADAKDSGGHSYVYNGSFSSDPTAYLQQSASPNGLKVEGTKSPYKVVENVAAVNCVQVGGMQYASLAEAVSAVSSGGTLSLILPVTLKEKLVVPSGKKITIDLNGLNLSGGSIENSGTLRFEDNSGAAQPGTLSTPVVGKAGTIDITFGNYAGTFTMEGGVLTTHNGTFANTFAATEAGGKVLLRGGQFLGEITVPDDCRLRSNYLGQKVIGHIADASKIGDADVSYLVNGFNPNDDLNLGASDKALYLNFMQSKSGWSSRGDFVGREALWDRLAELRSVGEPIKGQAFEASISFDRAVSGGTVSGWAKIKGVPKEMAMDQDLDPDEDYHILIPLVTGAGYTAKSFKHMFDGEDGGVWEQVHCGIENKSLANIGTTVTVKFQIRMGGEKVGFTFDTERFRTYKFTGNGAIYGATDYSSLAAALTAANYSGTVRLSKDCAEQITVGKVASFTIDRNNFDFTGTITVDDCYAVETTDLGEGKTQYEVKLAQVTVAIPEVANTTLAVTASAGEVEDLGNGQYQVSPGAKITATYTPNEGFFGEAIVKTIESATAGASVTVSDDEAASVKAIVAKIGDAPYASLAEAIVAAAELGETIDVVKESKLAVAEGAELTVTLGKLVAAVSEDDMLELKDGTDVTLTWPTAEGAGDYLVVTGGRYSADPSAFLADGLEAKEKDGKYVVGVKVVIVIDEEQEATEENTAEQTVTTAEQTSTVEEEKVEEVIKEVVPEEQKETFVNNIKTNTKVEGVKLTTVDEVVIPDETKPEEKEVVKESGVKAVVLAAKAAAQETAVAAADKTDAEKTQAEKDAAAFKAALEQKEKNVEITVKVEVQAKLVEYVPPAEAAVQEAPKGTIKFELKPEAVVTVAVENEEPVKQTVPVSNDMIDQKQKIKVSIYTGFKPVAITHDDDKGVRIETFEDDQIVYDEKTGVATVQISHFSTLTSFGNVNDVPAPKVYVAQIVSTGEKYETLQAAVNAATSGDLIEVLVPCEGDVVGGTVKFTIHSPYTDDEGDYWSGEITCAEGFIVQEGDDGHCGVYFEYFSPVCKVTKEEGFYKPEYVDYFYGSIAAAIAHSENNHNQTVVLLRDTDEVVVVDLLDYADWSGDVYPEFCKFTIDPNGHDFTGTITGVNGARAVKNEDGTWSILPPAAAKIGEKEYYTIDEALWDVKGGDTIVLFADVQTGSDFSPNGAVTIDTNGKEIWFSRGRVVDLTDGLLVLCGGGRVRIENVMSNEEWYNLDWKNLTPDTLVLKEGTYTLEQVPLYPLVEGFSLTQFVADGYAAEFDETGKIMTVIETTTVAKIGETKYATLAEAVAEVKDGETISLLADCDENVAGCGALFTLAEGDYAYTGTITIPEGYSFAKSDKVWTMSRTEKATEVWVNEAWKDIAAGSLVTVNRPDGNEYLAVKGYNAFYCLADCSYDMGKFAKIEKNATCYLYGGNTDLGDGISGYHRMYSGFTFKSVAAKGETATAYNVPWMFYRTIKGYPDLHVAAAGDVKWDTRMVLDGAKICIWGKNTANWSNQELSGWNIDYDTGVDIINGAVVTFGHGEGTMLVRAGAFNINTGAKVVVSSTVNTRGQLNVVGQQTEAGTYDADCSLSAPYALFASDPPNSPHGVADRQEVNVTAGAFVQFGRTTVGSARTGTLNVNASKYEVAYNEAGSGFAVANASVANFVNHSLLDSTRGPVTLAAGTALNLDATSKVIARDVVNEGLIRIDATGVGGKVKVIDYVGSGTKTLADYGDVNVICGTASVEDNDLYVEASASGDVCRIVDTDQPYATLAAAFGAVQDEQTIQILENCSLTQTISSSRSFTLDLNGKCVDGASKYGFRLSGTAVTIDDGAGGGRISYCLNAGVDGGGAIKYGNGSGTLTLKNGTLSKNTLTLGGGAAGGAIFVSSGNFVMDGGAIADNYSAGNGGGVSLSSGTFTMNAGTVGGNVAGNRGGGIALGASGKLLFAGGSIDGNTAGYGGGVYLGSDTATFTMTGGSVCNNKATDSSTGHGGGVFVESGSVTGITGGSFVANSAAKHGGAVYMNASGAVMIRDVLFDRNSAVGDAGALTFQTGDVTIENCTFSGNSCKACGGAINCGQSSGKSASLVINSGTFTGNSGYWGSCVNANYGPVTINGGTFTKNRNVGSGNAGGAIYVKYAPITIYDCFVANDNVSEYSYDGYSNASAGVFVWNNANGSGVVKIYGGTFNANTLMHMTKDGVEISGGKFAAHVRGHATAAVTAAPLKGGVYTATAKAETQAKMIASGYDFVVNVAEDTKDDYPWAIGVPVAQIATDGGAMKFATLDDAVVAAGDDDVTITVLGDHTKLTAPSGWEFEQAGEAWTLVRKSYVAEVVSTGAKFETVQEAIAAVTADGDTVKLLADVELAASLNGGSHSITIDGDGYTFTQKAGVTPYHWFCFGAQQNPSGVGKSFTFKNATIDGFTSGTYMFRVESCAMTIDNVTFNGCGGTYVVVFTYADGAVLNSVFTNNTAANRVIDFNSNANDDGGNDSLTIFNSLFKDNVANGTAIVGTAENKTVDVADCTFDSNIVNGSNNGAPLYLGDQCSSCTGSFFTNNVVNYTTTTGYDNRVRAAGAIFTWAAGEPCGRIVGNAFVDNRVVKQNANVLSCYAKSVYSGGYYNDDDLKDNFWETGRAAVVGQANIESSGNDVYAEYSEKTVKASTYAMSYTLNADGCGCRVDAIVTSVLVDDGDDSKRASALEMASVSSVDKTQLADVPEMTPEEETQLVESISQHTEVVGVKLTTEAEIDGSGMVITPSGVQAVIDAAKNQSPAFAEALAASSLVTVTVDVVVTPVAYTKPTEAAKAGSIKFKLEPRAIVSVNGKVVDPQTVPVTNEMIDQSRNISVSLYTGFRPAVITHDDDDGSRIETFGADGIDYDEATGVATVRISHFSTMTGYGDVNDVPAAKVYVAKIGETPYETLAEALDAAVAGNTVTLLKDIEGVTGTFEITKAITIDGNGHKIVAAANETPRDMITAYLGARVMFQVRAADGATFKNLTVDGGTTHYYTFLAETKGGVFTVENTQWLHGGEASVGGTAGVGYGAAIHVNGGNLLVDGAFHACTGGKTAGVFPFSGILYDDGGIHFNDGVTAMIGDDLLLVGMTGAPDVSTEEGKAYVEELLAAMNVPAGFAPYTLKLGDDSSLAFTGASPLGWNDIIDYGKQIMDVAGEIGYEGMDKEKTPVEVGLLTDTVLPEVFAFGDTNLTVNGNGNALSGTITYTDEAGQIANVELGTEEKPLVLDMTEVTKPVQLGDGIKVTDLVIKMTPEQATAGTPVVTWTADAAAPEGEEKVTVQLIEPETDQPVSTEEPVELIWDEELHIAYIGPVEARLTGPTHPEPIYTSLAEALTQAAPSGDTVTLMTNLVDYVGTIELEKSLTFDGANHKIAAKPVTEHRDIFSAYIQSRSMLKLKTGAVTLKNITLDGDASHAYTYLVSADNSSVSLTTENVRLVNGGELMGNENGEAVGDGAGYGAAVHLNNGATMVVKDGFYACTGGTTDGVFPFTGILVDSNGVNVKFDLTEDSNANPTVGIGSDLLLVGMPEAIAAETAQDILDAMKVPTRFIPYTLTLGDGTDYAFTGASPLGWNDIIEYGKEIMDASASMGYGDLNQETTPVEVGLLTDTVLPEVFTFGDTNLTVNGNGNALAGTIKYTDKAGEIENIELGTEDQPLVLDMTKVENPVHLGDGIKVTDLVIKMTPEQATAGTPVVTWTTDAEAPEGENNVVVKLVDPESSEPTGGTKNLIWDDEMHVAYIGPAKVRLTGPTHDQPIYTTLTAALAAAEDGDAIKLLENVALTDGVTFDMNVMLDLAGKEIGGESAAMTVGEGKTLTINDGSEEGSGVVASALVNDGGKLVITSGTFEKSISASEKVTDPTAAFALSGGTYSEDAIHLADDATVPLNDVCVEGYEAVDNGNGTWSVLLDSDHTVFELRDDDTGRIEVTFPEETKVPVTVTEAWVRENFDEYDGTEATKPYAAQINEVLDEKQANGMTGWQNYLLGVDGSETENPLTPDYRSRLNSATDEMITVIARANISLPAIDTGIVATFRLMQSTDLANWTQVDADASTPEFALDLSDLGENTYYKIHAVFTSSAAANE